MQGKVEPTSTILPEIAPEHQAPSPAGQPAAVHFLVGREAVR